MGDLYWGDNLEILRAHIPDESVDLIYLDPPFNSNRNYNVLFRETDRVESSAQIEAFTDTWEWSEQAEQTYSELITANYVPQNVTDLIIAMRSFIGTNDVMAYLVMMTIRLIELHRVLKPTGSIYLHCDPTASHYLKVVMDTIWGPKHFLNEIIWRRTTTKNDYKQGVVNWPRVHDVVLYYRRHVHHSPAFNQPFASYDEDYVRKKYPHTDPDGRRFGLWDVTAPGSGTRGHPRYELMGVTRFWRYNQAKMEALVEEGRVIQPRPGAVPRYKRYLDEMSGIAIGDTWDDIPPINSQAAERLGYPTQKPEALLERIIRASSDEGDVVLDPFCGCGTSVAVAERLNRRWIGIDVTHLAIAAIVSRMEAAFPGVEINREAEPKDVGGARELAKMDRYDFQDWALAFVGARPVAHDARGKSKRGTDRGIDGVIMFLGDDEKKPHRALVQVKSGHVNSGDIRDLKGTIERENAQMGLFITLEESTAPMRQEAVEAGFYRSELMQREYPRIQILTIRELFDKREPQIPPPFNPYRLAERRKREGQQPALFDTGTG